MLLRQQRLQKLACENQVAVSRIYCSPGHGCPLLIIGSVVDFRLNGIRSMSSCESLDGRQDYLPMWLYAVSFSED